MLQSFSVLFSILAFCPEFITSWAQYGCHSWRITSIPIPVQMREAEEWIGIKTDATSLPFFFRHKTLSPDFSDPPTPHCHPWSKCPLTSHPRRDGHPWLQRNLGIQAFTFQSFPLRGWVNVSQLFGDNPEALLCPSPPDSPLPSSFFCCDNIAWWFRVWALHSLPDLLSWFCYS